MSKKYGILILCLVCLTSVVLLGEHVESAEGEKKFSAVVLTSRKLTTPADLSTWEGIVRLRKELGITVDVVELTEISEYKEQVHAVSEEGYDVVYFIYDVFLPAVLEIAPKGLCHDGGWRVWGGSGLGSRQSCLAPGTR